MGIIESIIKANEDGREVTWPSPIITQKPMVAPLVQLDDVSDGTHPTLGGYRRCIRCSDICLIDEISFAGCCEYCSNN